VHVDNRKVRLDTAEGCNWAASFNNDRDSRKVLVIDEIEDISKE